MGAAPARGGCACASFSLCGCADSCVRMRASGCMYLAIFFCYTLADRVPYCRLGHRARAARRPTGGTLDRTGHRPPRRRTRAHTRARAPRSPRRSPRGVGASPTEQEDCTHLLLRDELRGEKFDRPALSWRRELYATAVSSSVRDAQNKTRGAGAARIVPAQLASVPQVRRTR